MKEIIATTEGAQPVGPYSQAIRANGLIFVSGQIPLDPRTHELVDGDIEAQCDRALRNVIVILEAAGSSMDKVIRCVVYLQSMSDFARMNQVYATFFKNDPPSRTTVAVAALPRDCLIEIEVTAIE
jgi:2-iminobutanoate/2-iminopropanoate deaminase